MLTLTDTKIQVLTCTACALHEHCRQPVPIRYDNPAEPPRYLVVGEAPGQIEDRRGEPFVGPSGMFLKRALRNVGLRPTDGAWLNAVSCFPSQNKTPTLDSIHSCRNNMYDQMDVTSANPVLVVGSIALSSLMPNASLSYAMGGPISWSGYRLFPVYHPSYILRTKSKGVYELWLRHLGKFSDMVSGLNVTRDTLQIANCMYCSAVRMDKQPYCIRHERLYVKDQERKRIKPPPPPQLNLFEE